MFVSIKVLNCLNRIHFEGSGKIRPVSEYGCYFCGKVYKVNDHPITEWVDGGQTAVCPVCSIDTVIPKLNRLGCNFDEHDMLVLRKQEFDQSDLAALVTIGKTNIPVSG